MRRLVFVNLLLLAAPATAQEVVDFTAKFGPPIVEQYHLQPDERLVVTYGQRHVVCEVRLEPWQESKRREDPAAIPGELVDRVLNELVPTSARVGAPLVMHEQMSRAALTATEYQNVRITRQTDGDNVTALVIRWKRPECQEQNILKP